LTGNDARFFFHVVSKGGGSGTINSVTLMDYTSGTAKEIAATETNKPISSGVTTVSIPWTGTVTALLRDAARASQGGFECFAEPGIAHRGGAPVSIHLAGPAASKAELIVRDAAGHTVYKGSSALDAAEPGHAALSWDLQDASGAQASPGTYFASVLLENGNRIVKSGTTKIIVN
jgi:hypothetical protein